MSVATPFALAIDEDQLAHASAQRNCHRSRSTDCTQPTIPIFMLCSCGVCCDGRAASPRMVASGHCARIPMAHAFVTNATPLSTNAIDACGYLFHA